MGQTVLIPAPFVGKMASWGMRDRGFCIDKKPTNLESPVLDALPWWMEAS